MHPQPHEILEAKYAQMTPDERKRLIALINRITARRLAAMTPGELQVARAKMIGVVVNNHSEN